MSQNTETAIPPLAEILPFKKFIPLPSKQLSQRQLLLPLNNNVLMDAILNAYRKI